MGPIAGYVADRLDRRTVLIWGDYLRGALFLTIPLVGTLWWIFVVTVLVEAISLVWGPAKDATVPNLVPRHRLEAANQVSLATTYGSALPAAAIFAGLTLVDRFYRQRLRLASAAGPVDLALYFNAVSFLVSGPRDRPAQEHPARSGRRRGPTASAWSVDRRRLEVRRHHARRTRPGHRHHRRVRGRRRGDRPGPHVRLGPRRRRLRLRPAVRHGLRRSRARHVARPAAAAGAVAAPAVRHRR